MPRILQLSPRLPLPLDDGGRIATWNLSRCLRHNGYDIDLVCFTSDASAASAHARQLAEVFSSVETVTKNVERQHPVDLAHALLTGSSYFVRKFATRAYTALIRQRLASHRYEATLIDGAFMGVYLPLLQDNAAAAGRVLLRGHNVEYEILDRLAENERKRWVRILLRREARHFRPFELDLIRRVDEVHTITRRDADVLTAAGIERGLSVLEPFIDADRYRRDPDLPIERYSIVHVGNMAWMPNINGINWFMERVWPNVLRAYPEARFYIVGKNPPPSIQRFASDNVIITGYVTDERPLMQKAHLFIVPLFEGSGVRIKILTGMSMGISILSTSMGAEGIAWPGLMIEDTPETWCAAIEKHFRTEPEVSQAAIEYIAKHYDWRRSLHL